MIAPGGLVRRPRSTRRRGRVESGPRQRPYSTQRRFCYEGVGQPVQLQAQDEAKAVLDIFEHLAGDLPRGLCQDLPVKGDQLRDIADSMSVRPKSLPTKSSESPAAAAVA